MLHETDNELSRSRRILKRLAMSTIYNKIILVIIIIVQVRYIEYIPCLKKEKLAQEIILFNVGISFGF
jgi:hypothetical protein